MRELSGETVPLTPSIIAGSERSGKGICAYLHGTQPRCPYFEKGRLSFDEELQESYRQNEENCGGKRKDRKPDFGKGDGQVAGDFQNPC
jgi:hypothetical protein